MDKVQCEICGEWFNESDITDGSRSQDANLFSMSLRGL